MNYHLFNIFEYLSIVDISSCSNVNKTWKKEALKYVSTISVPEYIKFLKYLHGIGHFFIHKLNITYPKSPFLYEFELENKERIESSLQSLYFFTTTCPLFLNDGIKRGIFNFSSHNSREIIYSSDNLEEFISSEPKLFQFPDEIEEKIRILLKNNSNQSFSGFFPPMGNEPKETSEISYFEYEQNLKLLKDLLKFDPEKMDKTFDRLKQEFNNYLVYSSFMRSEKSPIILSNQPNSYYYGLKLALDNGLKISKYKLSYPTELIGINENYKLLFKYEGVKSVKFTDLFKQETLLEALSLLPKSVEILKFDILQETQTNETLDIIIPENVKNLVILNLPYGMIQCSDLESLTLKGISSISKDIENIIANSKNLKKLEFDLHKIDILSSMSLTQFLTILSRNKSIENLTLFFTQKADKNDIKNLFQVVSSLPKLESLTLSFEKYSSNENPFLIGFEELFSVKKQFKKIQLNISTNDNLFSFGVSSNVPTFYYNFLNQLYVNLYSHLKKIKVDTFKIHSTVPIFKRLLIEFNDFKDLEFKKVVLKCKDYNLVPLEFLSKNPKIETLKVKGSVKSLFFELKNNTNLKYLEMPNLTDIPLLASSIILQKNQTLKSIKFQKIKYPLKCNFLTTDEVKQGRNREQLVEIFSPFTNYQPKRFHKFEKEKKQKFLSIDNIIERFSKGNFKIDKNEVLN